ncbi:hypothetical protein ACIOTI_32150 [Streptomyces sp. NPDC087843]|uniref:hypothetical protein n=1 Tax=Streptomyces sp. NPDC087843 TaxID=3365804 RepID=UPI0038297012
MARERVFEPVIDQHDTWLAVNPVQGCPKGCAYCYLTDLGLTRTKPAVLATPEETIAQLLAHRYYHPDLVLALYTCTDALATPATRAHLTALLDALGDSAIRNPVCLITKCAVPDDVVDCITRNRAAGLPVLVYLSYSGLGADIEQGIDRSALRANFPRLHAAGVPVIHYWRPALPQNSTPAVIEHVMEWAARYAMCSVAVGTKVKPSALDQITGLWPELADPNLDPRVADSVWPRSTWDWLRHLPDRYGDHPVFQTNSCALAHVLGRADRAGVWNTPTCLDANRCPAPQRTRCRRTIPHQRPVTETDVAQHLARLGHPHLPYTLSPATRTVVLDQPLQLRDRHNLAQVLAVTVRSPEDPSERYWPGRLSGGQPLIIDPQP